MRASRRPQADGCQLRIERTRDAELIARIMRHPRIWPHITDDTAPPKDEWSPQLDEALFYLSVIDHPDTAGLFLFHPHNAVTFEFHTCLLPRWWGPPAVEAAYLAMVWMLEHTTCRKVITQVPADNRPAFAYARRLGLQLEGRNRASFLKNGQLIHQHWFGLTEDEICRQSQRQ